MVKKKKKNSLPFKVFPGGQPGKYYNRPTDFELADQTSRTLFSVVCSLTGDFCKSFPYYSSQRKNGHPSKAMTQVQFLTKYSNRLKGQSLSKHHRVNLDLDGLRKPRYPRMTKAATKRVWVLSLWCLQRQETFVNLGLFQTSNNYSSFLSLCPLTAFFIASYSLMFLSSL